MDQELVEIEARRLTAPETLPTPEALEAAVLDLITQLTRIANDTTPRRKVPVGRGEQWWTPQVAEAVAHARRARRCYYTRPGRQTWQRLQETIAKQQWTIRDAKRKSWRKAVADASNDSRQI